MIEKKEWITPAIFVLSKGNDNGNVLFACSTDNEGCSEGGPADPTEGQGSV